MLLKCSGCALSMRNPQSVVDAKCIIRTKYENVWSMGKIRKDKIKGNPDQSCILTPLPTSQYYKPKAVQRNTTESGIDKITLWNRDIKLIHKAVNNTIVQEELINLWSEFKNREQTPVNVGSDIITIYTDGSLTQ